MNLQEALVSSGIGKMQLTPDRMQCPKCGWATPDLEIGLRCPQCNIELDFIKRKVQ